MFLTSVFLSLSLKYQYKHLLVRIEKKIIKTIAWHKLLNYFLNFPKVYSHWAYYLIPSTVLNTEYYQYFQSSLILKSTNDILFFLVFLWLLVILNIFLKVHCYVNLHICIFSSIFTSSLFDYYYLWIDQAVSLFLYGFLVLWHDMNSKIIIIKFQMLYLSSYKWRF